MKKIAIIGSGDLGQSIAWYASQNEYKVVGFYDDFSTADNLNGYKVLGKTTSIESDYKAKVFDSLVCAIGYKHLVAREEIFNRFSKMGIPFAKIIDKSCYVDSSATISQGVVMFPGAFVDKDVILEDNVLLNVCVTIAHDSKIGSHSFLSPRVAMAGFSSIGKRCMIGINSTIIDNVHISNDIRLGGGTLVISDLKQPGLYVGSPAKWKKI